MHGQADANQGRSNTALDGASTGRRRKEEEEEGMGGEGASGVGSRVAIEIAER